VESSAEMIRGQVRPRVRPLGNAFTTSGGWTFCVATMFSVGLLGFRLRSDSFLRASQVVLRWRNASSGMPEPARRPGPRRPWPSFARRLQGVPRDGRVGLVALEGNRSRPSRPKEISRPCSGRPAAASSTLLNMVAGFDGPDFAARLLFSGAAREPPGSAAQASCFQEAASFPGSTCSTNNHLRPQDLRRGPAARLRPEGRGQTFWSRWGLRGFERHLTRPSSRAA